MARNSYYQPIAAPLTPPAVAVAAPADLAPDQLALDAVHAAGKRRVSLHTAIQSAEPDAWPPALVFPGTIRWFIKF